MIKLRMVYDQNEQIIKLHLHKTKGWKVSQEMDSMETLWSSDDWFYLVTTSNSSQ